MSNLGNLYPPGTTTTGTSPPPSNLGAIQAPAIAATPIIDVIRLAYAAGFRGNDLITAVAVALARSGLNARMVDASGTDNQWGAKVGLWGIRSLNDQHNTGGARDEVVNVDPWRNAQTAFDLYHKAGNTFSDWSAFTSGAYRQYVDQVRQAVAAAGNEQGIAQNVTQARTQGLYTPSLNMPVGWKPPAAPAPAAAPPRGAAPAAPAPAAPAPSRQPQPTVISTISPSYIQPTNDPFPSGGNPAQQEAWIRAHYGAIAYMLDNPELGPILRQAAREGWDDGRFTAALQATHWFQTHNAGQRDFDALVHNDPQEAEQRLRNQTQTLIDQAHQVGIDLTPDRARQIALHGLQMGFGPGDWTQAIAGEFHYNPSAPKAFGSEEERATQMRAEAAAYGVTVSDGFIAGFLQSQLQGKASADDYTAELARQATLKYPWWSQQIAQGLKPADLASPYTKLLANTYYGGDDSRVTLEDPSIKAMLGQVDPKTGQPAPMGLWAAEQYLKRPGSQYWTDPHNTDALNTAASMATELAQKMGQVA